MDKIEMLALMRLLAALESWALSQQARLPDYLHEEIVNAQDILQREILK